MFNGVTWFYMNHLTKAKLVKLSICPCGFTLLDTSILMGTEYEVDPNRTLKATMICGNCSNNIPVDCIWVEKRENSAAGFLPAEIFSLQDPVSSSRGFSLIEIMVTVTLLAVIILGLVAMLNQTQRAFSQSLTQMDVLLNGRLAAEIVARDVEALCRQPLPGGAFMTWNDSTNVWALPVGQSLTNIQESVVILVTERASIHSVGYLVNLDTNGIGTLMRIDDTNKNSICDGVVSFQMIPIDRSGARINTNLLSFTNLPAAVNVELSVLEKRALDQYNALSNSPLARQFLTNQAGHLHIFRQRISIKAAQP